MTSVTLTGVASSGGDSSFGLAESNDSLRKKGFLANSFWIVRCGKRLILLPWLFSSSNFLASSLLWKAKASSGDRAGGIEPVVGEARLVCEGVYKGRSRGSRWCGISMCCGRCDMVAGGLDATRIQVAKTGRYGY
jgi:hypothetical protein